MDIRDLRAAGEHTEAGIYTITNLITFKIYVGSAIHINNRFKNHKKKLKHNKHPNKHLQASYNLLGFECFSFDSIEYCNKEVLLEREAYWIELTDCTNPKLGYNKRKIPNSNLGLKWTPETNAKRAASNIGKCRNKGIIPTLEHRAKISASMRGIKHSAEHIEKRIAYKRKPDKWPHGYKCKCLPCMKLKSQAIRTKQIANAKKDNDLGH